MKKISLYLVIIAIIILAVCTVIFNGNLQNSSSKRIDIYIGKDFEIKDIESLANEVLNKKTVVQTADETGSMVAITVSDATDEEIDNLKTKIYEKYNVAETQQSSTVTEIPAASIIDEIKPYIAPVGISIIIIAVYSLIKFVIIKNLNK